MKPKPFQNTRPEYQAFDLEDFRKHIYQEEYAQSGRSYWLHKNQKKQEMKEQIKKAAQEIIEKKETPKEEFNACDFV